MRKAQIESWKWNHFVVNFIARNGKIFPALPSESTRSDSWGATDWHGLSPPSSGSCRRQQPFGSGSLPFRPVSPGVKAVAPPLRMS